MRHRIFMRVTEIVQVTIEIQTGLVTEQCRALRMLLNGSMNIVMSCLRIDRAVQHEPLLPISSTFRRDNHVLYINEVQLLAIFAYCLTFNDGVVKDVDLSEELFGRCLNLCRSGLICQVTINPETRTIEWPNGADLHQNFCNELGRTHHPGKAMSDTVTLTIDGQEITVSPKRRSSSRCPTRNRYPGHLLPSHLTANGLCRVCSVDAGGRLQSCGMCYAMSPGMQVRDK